MSLFGGGTSAAPYVLSLSPVVSSSLTLSRLFSSFSFGQPSTSTATSTPSLFGSTPAPASNSLFGGGGSGTAGNPGTPTTAPASGGLFGGGGGGLFGGGQSTAGQTQSKPAFSFGTSAPTTTPSLFGGASNTAQPATGGGGLFGSTSNTQGGGIFGQPRQQQQQQQPQAGGGLFGSTNNSCVSLVRSSLEHLTDAISVWCVQRPLFRSSTSTTTESTKSVWTIASTTSSFYIRYQQEHQVSGFTGSSEESSRGDGVSRRDDRS